MRGVSFTISSPKGRPLQQILKCINIKKYRWYVIGSQNDTWDSSMEHLLFHCDAYEGNDFYEIINQDHFVIFLKLQAYNPEGSYDEILSYQDFEKSDCQLLLLIHDCRNIDMYLKNQTLIEKVYEYVAGNNSFQNIRYVCDDNDTRTKMCVV